MGRVITFGIQKGGSAKTTSAGVVSYLLSQQAKVLAVDMDSQGNLTELLTQQDIYQFDRTILEALKMKNALGHIYKVTEMLHLIPANDLLATFSRYLYTEFTGNRSLVLVETLQSVVEQYDYIIIDTPPALGDQTINSLAASDAVVVMFEASKFCYAALDRFFETIEHVKEKVNPRLKVAGILRTMIDKRRLDAQALIDLVKEEYDELVFDTIINHRAATGRISIHGFNDNPELKQALSQYQTFVKELIERV